MCIKGYICVYAYIHQIGLPSTYEGKYTTFAFLILAYFNKHNDIQFHPFTYKQHNSIYLYGYTIFHCVYITHFLKVFIRCQVTGLFPSLAIFYSASISMGMQVSLLYPGLNSFQYMPRSGVAYVRSIFTFWGTSIVVTQQRIRVPFPLNPLHNLLLLVWLMIAILTGVSWYLNIIFSCISLWPRMLGLSSRVYWPSVRFLELSSSFSPFFNGLLTLCRINFFELSVYFV
jgi:hypothetical protein